MNKLGKVMVALTLGSMLSPAMAGSLTGTVTAVDGGALEGVLIRAKDNSHGVAESVYTDAEGRFSLTTDLTGELEVRLRYPYFRDVETQIELAEDAEVTRAFTMEAMTRDKEISESLPAAYHFGSLNFETGENAVFSRYQFQRDCLSCHQMGNKMTRQPRSPEAWEVSIKRMHRYVGSNFDAKLRERRSKILSTGFNGEPIDVRPKFPLDPSLNRAKFYEYSMDKGNVPHDAIVNLDDGLIYTVDQGAHFMAITDPDTGQTEYFPQTGKAQQYWVPDSGMGKVADYESPVRPGPHSLALGHDGKYYVTNTNTNTIGVFNPKSREWEPSHVIGGGAYYPHTIRVGHDGMVWFTVAGSERVGRLNPNTGETKVIVLPKVRSGGVSGGTQPYGIDVHPEDGSIWYSRLFGDKIGRIDPDNLELQEFDSPVRGPRRMRFDEDGMLWVTGYSEGVLARLAVSESGFESRLYPMPEFAEGYRPAPYALGVHPQTQEVWINENMTDRFYRFIPEEERFVVYPVPLRGTYTRDFSFTADGKACTSNNPLPIVALEEGVAEIVCIKLR